jgi:hypothetical protein
MQVPSSLPIARCQLANICRRLYARGVEPPKVDGSS